jgi:hypothetical protein
MKPQCRVKTMSDDGNDTRPPLTEPEPLPVLFATGCELQVSEEHVVRLTFWVDLPKITGLPRQARIQAKIAMPYKGFRQMLSDGRRVGRRSH